MSNTRPCSECILYHAIIKPHRKGGESHDTGKGHCLDKTVYAKNRAGHPVYPPRAKVADLPYARHSIVLRRGVEVVPHCTAIKPMKG
jgi:hypothetical protein